jgi:predicted RNA binding protein YcfA (HicA-like mRNA interferase family)
MAIQSLLKRCKSVSKLTSVDYDQVIKALARIGYAVNNQKGSHIVMRLVDQQKYISLFGCRKNEVMVVVPAHKPLGKGMLRTIIREVDLSVEEFNKLL